MASARQRAGQVITPEVGPD